MSPSQSHLPRTINFKRAHRIYAPTSHLPSNTSSVREVLFNLSLSFQYQKGQEEEAYVALVGFFVMEDYINTTSKHQPTHG